MKRILIIFILLGWVIQSQAQVKVWREINLRVFPNKLLTGEVGFRDILFEAMKSGKIKVYPYTEKFAHFGKPLYTRELIKYLSYFDDSVMDTVEVRYWDLSKLELQETYYPKRKGNRRFRIKKITLWGGWSKQHTYRLSFKYQEVKTLLNQVYQTSLKLNDLARLQAYWQSPQDVTLQTSVPTALENRRFASKVIKTVNLKKKYQARFKQLTEYQPTKMKDWEVKPKFLRVGKHTLRATVRFRVNLMNNKNFPFYRLGRGIVGEIIKGVKAKKLTPYEYRYSPPWTFTPMQRKKFFDEIYYDDILQTVVRSHLSNIHRIELLGYWDLNIITKKTTFRLIQINLWVPPASKESQINDLTLFAIITFKYEELKPYFEQRFMQAKKTGRHYGAWVKNGNTLDRMSFAQALEKGLFTKQIVWYANQQNDNIELLFNRMNNIEKLGRKKAKRLYQKMQQKVQKNLENFKVK